MWDDHKRRISLYLPAVKQEKHPAKWRIGKHSQKAATNPDELFLDSEAFHNPLFLKLESKDCSESQRLRGLDPWGLFDMESGGRQVVNPDRDELPLKSYLMVSQRQLEVVRRDGFDQRENPVNEEFELSDGTVCFVTRLWPMEKYAELQIRKQDGNVRTICFRTRTKIEARFFVGWGKKAAYFGRTSTDKVVIDHLPILCVTIPLGYFKDNSAELWNTFKVLIDGKVAGGHWKKLEGHENDDREFYEWRWNRKPILEPRPGIRLLKSFHALGKALKSADLSGERNISVEARPHIQARFEVKVISRSKDYIDKPWQKLPGAFLPWFLLCQSREGMKWDDLMLAKDVIAPDLRISYYLLRKYAHNGLLLQRGHKWEISESRVVLKPLSDDKCQMDYCGDPSILWGLYRWLYHKEQYHELPTIEIIDKRGDLPFLQMIWQLRLHGSLERYLKKHNVVIGTQLWTH